MSVSWNGTLYCFSFDSLCSKQSKGVLNMSVLRVVSHSGPPDPVSDIEVFKITETSALLEFKPGFNYNNTQWFKIHIETSNRGKLNSRVCKLSINPLSYVNNCIPIKLPIHN